MNLNPLKQFSFTPKMTAVQAKQTNPQVEDKALPQEQLSVGQNEPVSYSRNAFVDGVGAGSEMATIGAGVVAGASGGFTIGALTVGLLAAGLAVTGPLAAGMALVAGGAGALMGAAGGASLAEKASAKFGEWGSKLAGKLGFSSKGGEAAGRASLAVGLAASSALAGPVALFALTCGLANKGVGMAIDAARQHFA